MTPKRTIDVARMRDSVFFEGPDLADQLSRFWILLILAAVIAAAGVAADSTATVIGAMIVAPLMIPIQGTMLAVVLRDRSNLVRSVLLVLAGAAAAVAVGWLVGILVPGDVVAQNNSQVASRVAPKLIDLLAAVATGVVGSIALIRSDISDTLPGVAIAISLVPPLTVAGLTLSSGEPAQSIGALLLFTTNVAAILATGTVVMGIYGVYSLAQQQTTGPASQVNRRVSLLVIAAMVVIVGIPLTNASISIYGDTVEQLDASTVGSAWASEEGWELMGVTRQADKMVVRFEGPTPLPSTESLKMSLSEAGIDVESVVVELIPRAEIDFGSSD